jgi:hypothetical protein
MTRSGRRAVPGRPTNWPEGIPGPFQWASSSPYDGFVPGLGVGNQKTRYVCWGLGDDAMANGKLNWEANTDEPDLPKRVE